MFTVTKGATVAYPRAYALHLGTKGTYVFVGTWDRLTARRKADMARTVLAHLGRDADLGERDLVLCFDTNPFCDRRNLTITPTTMANDDDASDIRLTLAYSHNMGSGEWDLGTTYLHTVA